MKSFRHANSARAEQGTAEGMNKRAPGAPVSWDRGHLHSHGLLHMAAAIGHEGLPGSSAGWGGQQDLSLRNPGPLLEVQNVQLCMPALSEAASAPSSACLTVGQPAAGAGACLMPAAMPASC